MTPKEKASQLFAKFFCATPQPYTIENIGGLNFNDWDKNWTNETAKKYAIIMVDEIINDIGFIEDSNYAAICQWKNNGINYWREVEKELMILI